MASKKKARAARTTKNAAHPANKKNKKKKARSQTSMKKAAPASNTRKKVPPSPPRKAKISAAESPEMTNARVTALAKVFAALGARTPEKWARDHVDRGSDELGRFVLLRALWLRTVEPGRLLAQAHADSHAGPALARLLMSANLVDLDAIVRFAQRTALAEMIRVLDDPSAFADEIRWGLFRVDNQGMPLWALEDLKSGLEDSEP